jgi:hypothetical protein
MDIKRGMEKLWGRYDWEMKWMEDVQCFNMNKSCEACPDVFTKMVPSNKPFKRFQQGTLLEKVAQDREGNRDVNPQSREGGKGRRKPKVDVHIMLDVKLGCFDCE